TGVGSMAMVFRLKVASQKKQYRPFPRAPKACPFHHSHLLSNFYTVTMSGFHLSAGIPHTYSITFPLPCSAEHPSDHMYCFYWCDAPLEFFLKTLKTPSLTTSGSTFLREKRPHSPQLTTDSLEFRRTDLVTGSDFVKLTV